MSSNFIEIFGENVFNDKAMQKYLLPNVYASLQSVSRGAQLTIEIADAVAEGMLAFATERGATHYTHWFQPMNGLTAEKHDAFLSLDAYNRPIKFLTGKALIKGEADGSSFPSGGLRATFEARGYTTWDCTSPAFVREGGSGMTVLCIPTAFCSFSGQALDEKTPLLRSMEAINREALRVLKQLGVPANSVVPMVGGEQEYFLIDKEIAKYRKDLTYTGRTLFGAPPAKGQELEDQYYAPVNDRVSAFMDELNHELWKVGVLSKTQHNEAAPSQYELAPYFSTANIATDQNQLIMEYMRTIADRHGFVCLLHEKPFDWINGSGKHNNWSLVTDTGVNLLKRDKSGPNKAFLTFFIATISALDSFPELMRASCSTLGNDCRLGGNEAPPPIISAYIGQTMAGDLERVENNKGTTDGAGVEKMTIGVSSLAVLHKDDADRNRTSPFAFTGNKFEFRMVGASQSLAFANTALNTAVADQLARLAEKLESAADKEAALNDWMRESVVEHKRVVFNGNNYSKEWVEEAVRRGLPILGNAVSAVETLTKERVVEVFARMGVLSREELAARQDIMLRQYAKQMHIEALTMLKMSRKELLPASVKQLKAYADAFNALNATGLGLDSSVEALLRRVSEGINGMHDAVEALAAEIRKEEKNEVPLARARFQRERVRPAMEKLRLAADELERIVDKELWPLPSYGEMLFV